LARSEGEVEGGKGQSQGERLSKGAKGAKEAKEAKGAKGHIDTWAVEDERRKEGFPKEPKEPKGPKKPKRITKLRR